MNKRKTVQPDERLEFNEWCIYVKKQLEKPVTRQKEKHRLKAYVRHTEVITNYSTN